MADIANIVDVLSKLTVMEAADLVKKLEETWGVTAAAPMVAAAAPAQGGGAAAPAAEAQTTFDVILKSLPADKKIAVPALFMVGERDVVFDFPGMRQTVDLLREARETRDLASRARKLAERVTEPADKDRLRRHAEELRAQAARLEKEADAAKRAPLF